MRSVMGAGPAKRVESLRPIFAAPASRADRNKLPPMPKVHPCPLPAEALLAKYAKAGAYTDCYTTQIARSVSHAEFVETFYTGRLFKLERGLLALFLAKPSTDSQARQLAAGEVDDFAAWRVEGRTANQLLLCAVGDRTRSWLMVAWQEPPAAATQLYFGSAVVPVTNRATTQSSMGLLFKALLGFHKLYSRALLGSAASRLAKASR